MRLSRFFVDQPLSLGQHDLPEAQAHYIGRVLRHATGDAVQLFDGSGREYLGELVEVGKKNVRVELREQFAGQPDSPLRIHLGQGLSRGERMDWAIQKATELGVAEITPIVSERCEVRLKDERADKRLQHWRQVAISACAARGLALKRTQRRTTSGLCSSSGCVARTSLSAKSLTACATGTSCATARKPMSVSASATHRAWLVWGTVVRPTISASSSRVGKSTRILSMKRSSCASGRG